jgi:hypothetical protein
MATMSLSQDSDTSTRLKAIDKLDLSMVKMKLCLTIEKEGKGWSQLQAEASEVQYKRFLKLCVLYEGRVVPTRDIDEMWHAHILDTKAYIEDCQRVFGSYLHHFPYFGLRDDEDAKDLANAFAETVVLFKKHFGEDPRNSIAAGCNSGGGGKCGRGCSRH